MKSPVLYLRRRQNAISTAYLVLLYAKMKVCVFKIILCDYVLLNLIVVAANEFGYSWGVDHFCDVLLLRLCKPRQLPPF